MKEAKKEKASLILSWSMFAVVAGLGITSIESHSINQQGRETLAMNTVNLEKHDLNIQPTSKVERDRLNNLSLSIQKRLSN